MGYETEKIENFMEKVNVIKNNIEKIKIRREVNNEVNKIDALMKYIKYKIPELTVTEAKKIIE